MNKKIIFSIAAIVVVLLTTVSYFLLKDENFTKTTVFENETKFTIIVLPDTQKYVKDFEDAEILTKQTQWIVNNKEKLNIQFVIHEGDIVDNSDNLEQWNRANKSLSILDSNNIPYSVIPGNHDHSTELYDKYFPVERFSENLWYKGNFQNNTNNYQILTIRENEFLFLNLDVCPDQDEINWANQVLEQNKNKKIILTTHAYLDENEERDVHYCGNTEYIWNDLIRKYENLNIVLCGHVHDEAYRIDENNFNKKVHQMLADYQSRDNGGNGWLRILEFYPNRNQIQVKTYSPYLELYETDSNSEFSFSYEVN